MNINPFENVEHFNNCKIFLTLQYSTCKKRAKIRKYNYKAIVRRTRMDHCVFYVNEINIMANSIVVVNDQLAISHARVPVIRLLNSNLHTTRLWIMDVHHPDILTTSALKSYLVIRKRILVKSFPLKLITRSKENLILFSLHEVTSSSTVLETPVDTVVGMGSCSI